MNYLKDVTTVNLQHINGELTILEAGVNNSFLAFKRIFYITQPRESHRGKHAHKDQKQLLICLQGHCEVICDDGSSRKSFHLADCHTGLYVPPGIWAEQIYQEDNTILLVACDAHYDETDYIRDYQAFLAYRNH